MLHEGTLKKICPEFRERGGGIFVLMSLLYLPFFQTQNLISGQFNLIIMLLDGVKRPCSLVLVVEVERQALVAVAREVAHTHLCLPPRPAQPREGQSGGSVPTSTITVVT